MATNQLRFGINLVTPTREIEKKILKAISTHLNSRAAAISSDLSEKLKGLIVVALQASPTSRELISGELRGELGVVGAEAQLETIFHAIGDATRIKVSPARISGKVVKMTFQIFAVPMNLSAIAGMAGNAGSYETQKGVEIPWFDWLTELGDAVIVREYDVEAGHPSKSRTGGKIMVKGKGWRVPTEHAGTHDNNFVTKAVEKILPQLETEIKQSFNSRL